MLEQDLFPIVQHYTALDQTHLARFYFLSYRCAPKILPCCSNSFVSYMEFVSSIKKKLSISSLESVQALYLAVRASRQSPLLPGLLSQVFSAATHRLIPTPRYISTFTHARLRS